MKGVFPWLVHWTCLAGTRDFYPALAALVFLVQNIFSSPYTFSLHLSPSPNKPGRQSCWVAWLLVCVFGGSLWGDSFRQWCTECVSELPVSYQQIDSHSPTPFQRPSADYSELHF
jgi:hypothetical protein